MRACDPLLVSSLRVGLCRPHRHHRLHQDGSPLGRVRGGRSVVSLSQPADGIPFRIRGTTTNPVFEPDLNRAAGALLTSPDAAGKAIGALGGLLGVKR